ncbi:MAG: M1 family metallopeptidase [FCB group bacterium]|nr:M1 family metallopeptidase [FCB group bacterium]
MFYRFFKTLFFLSLVIIGVKAQAATASLATFQKHDIKMTLKVPSHQAIIEDKGVIDADRGWAIFLLSKTAKIKSFTIFDRKVKYIFISSQDSSKLPSELKGNLPPIEKNEHAGMVLFKKQQIGEVPFLLKYTAEFNEDVKNVRFSNENVGREIAGTILDQGAYLSPDAYYYPEGNESLAKFKLTVDIPSKWESISDGNRLSSQTKGKRKIQVWEDPFKSDGLMFMAAPYVIKSTKTDNNIDVYCYFFPADTGLFGQYLKATVGYIEMYSKLIGPYPYQRFTVAENFFPTGYGMPAWTLLGQQVLRLPFIVRTSLGHEVLHNWWGNSVFVDYKRGNWCEAATVYGADYRYKLLQSPEAARDYRKNILKQYVSYVNKGNDFPIRDFKSRTSPNTRTIGYNKAMMVFHLIEREIGTKAFFDTWKYIYKKYRGKEISWEEWIDAFEKVSGDSLSYIIPQWIDRAGAPELGLTIEKVTKNPENNMQTVSFHLLEKGGQEYRLHIPLRFLGNGVTLDTSVVFDSYDSLYSIVVSDKVDTLEVDPDYHIFRKLYPEEIEPIIAAVMGQQKKRFVVENVSDTSNQFFKTFGENLTGDTITVDVPDVFQETNRDYAPIILNPTDLTDYLKSMVALTADSVTILKQKFPRQGYTFILTGQNWNDFKKYMLVLTDDYKSLPRLGTLIPHYGKYSFLVFDGTHNVAKGQWLVKSSPLIKKLK